MIPSPGLSLVDMAFEEGIDVCLATGFIAFTLLRFTANIDWELSRSII